MAGVKILGVRYSNSAVRMADLVGGQVQLTIDAAGSVLPHVKSGKLRALGMGGLEPSKLTPGIPTIASTGLPGYESVGVTGILAPTKTPPAVISRLNQEITRVLNQNDVKEKFFGAGVDVVASSPEQFAASFKSDMTTMTKVINDAGIRAE
jgi:tripartite-type tricarboxylate transporter receptor subunit TctC